MHLKRFRNDDYGRVSRKVHTVIDFPLCGLDMSPYTLPPPDAADQQRIAALAAPPERAADPAMTPPYMYDAYAVLQHIGNDLTHGHYTTVVRDVEPVGLQTREAYILFYERTAGVGDGGRL